MSDAKKIRNEALEEAALEVEGIVQSKTHPNGRRAMFIDSVDMAEVYALNQAAAAIRALKDSEE